MKKFTLLLALMVSNLMLTFAQNDIVLYIVDRPDWQYLCIDNQQRVIIYMIVVSFVGLFKAKKSGMKIR